MTLQETIRNTMPLTVGEMVRIATEHNVPVTDVVIEEEMLLSGRSREEILDLVMVEYEHNLKAVEIGADGGEVFCSERSQPNLTRQSTKSFLINF